ncbi:cell wall-binding repeat-containing protein [Peptostreptococcus canis]|uniref:Cell wall-binding repeat-containing protein n=1 Tax=Peptostreptococcus canis TaxID=1159213 RepID=A0ABR6TM99_9FIRM|nr:cell wall-binding repeat-containing protein [Peptostreptococcus canis]MBC2576546.1 cell wall-binding repeat-containing protein [Peptostreptococcus canis]MBP1998732.1 putative cell wall-binding protein [Peptostreptococcus canis]
MVKNFKKLLVLSSILVLISSTSSYADMNVSRISGRDRYETALKVQQKYFVHADGNLAIIASGKDFRTALYGSYMANALKVPFFVNPTSGLNKSIINELNRLNVKKVYLMGDVKTLNRNIENFLLYKKFKTTRFQDKYEDGYLNPIQSYVDTPIFNTFHYGEPRGDMSNGIIINDKKFPDLLASIPLVSELARVQATYLGSFDGFYINSSDDPRAEGWRFIIGGYATVPSYMGTFPGDKMGLNIHSWDEENFDSESIFHTGRIVGQNRYNTAIEIAKAYEPVLNKDINTIVLVDGTNYPDALASGTVATFENGAILLTQPNKLNEDTRDFIEENNIEKVIIVGGEKSVSKNVENELRNLK